MSADDAWSCTLRDYVSILTHSEKKSVRVSTSQESQEEIIEHFELQGLMP